MGVSSNPHAGRLKIQRLKLESDSKVLEKTYVSSQSARPDASPFPQPFCFIQAFNCLDGAHHIGEGRLLYLVH